MEPKISIVVPIYNAEKYIHKCINSILNQSFYDFELILVDDGSSDNSAKVCDEYTQKDNRIKVIHKDNGGVSSARNAGMDIAQGKYLMFCDSDDWVERDWCYGLLTNVDQKSCALGICGFHWYDYDKNIYKIALYSEQDYFQRLKVQSIFELRKADLFNTLWNKIFVLEIIKNNKLKFDTSLSLGEDVIFILEYLEKMNTDIVVVNKPLYHYVFKTSENLGSKYYNNLFDIYKLLFKKLYDVSVQIKVDFSKNNDNYYNAYFKALLRVLDNTFNEKNSMNFIEKVKFNTMILKSREFKECLANSSLEEYNKYFTLFLKSESYLLFYTFIKLYNLKVQIKRNMFKVN